jgi:hypothetical protein
MLGLLPVCTGSFGSSASVVVAEAAAFFGSNGTYTDECNVKISLQLAEIINRQHACQIMLAAHSK